MVGTAWSNGDQAGNKPASCASHPFPRTLLLPPPRARSIDGQGRPVPPFLRRAAILHARVRSPRPSTTSWRLHPNLSCVSHAPACPFIHTLSYVFFSMVHPGSSPIRFSACSSGDWEHQSILLGRTFWIESSIDPHRDLRVLLPIVQWWTKKSTNVVDVMDDRAHVRLAPPRAKRKTDEEETRKERDPKFALPSVVDVRGRVTRHVGITPARVVEPNG